MMPKKLLLVLALTGVVCTGTTAWSQISPMDAAARAVAEEEAANDQPAPVEGALAYDDYTVKSYALTFFGGSFSGAKFLELPELNERTVLTEGAGDILAYDGTVLIESRDAVHYTAPEKEIETGTAFGGRVGIYISDDFHLDLVGSYATSRARTTMLYTKDRDDLAANPWTRIEVDEDPEFKVYKGGLALAYEARPASIFGLVPQLGFGLGGIINRFGALEDKTALYLEGNFGLNAEVFDNFELGGRIDLATFAFEVDELGYSNMVSYTTFSIGATWHIDVLPSDVRAAHDAEKSRRR
jgi:hypothetical protein